MYVVHEGQDLLDDTLDSACETVVDGKGDKGTVRERCQVLFGAMLRLRKVLLGVIGNGLF